MSDSPARPTFSSAFAAVCATAGVAIGLGNIWRFPYMMGKHGGAVFLLLYLVIVAAFGLPVLMAEWALGRHTRRGPWQAFERAGLPGGRFFSAVISNLYIKFILLLHTGTSQVTGTRNKLAIGNPTELFFNLEQIKLGMIRL